jgi:hypothetical protein
MRFIPYGTTSKIDEIFIRSALTGGPLTGLTNASFTGGAYLEFRRVNEATARRYTGANVLSIATLATWADPGPGNIRIKERGNGYYEIQFENTVFAAGASTIDIAATLTWYGVANMLQMCQDYTLFAAADMAAMQASINLLPTSAQMDTKLAAADDATLAAIGSLNNLSQAQVRSALGMSSANLDTQLAAKSTQTSVDAVQTTVNSRSTQTSVDALQTSVNAKSTQASVDGVLVAVNAIPDKFALKRNAAGQRIPIYIRDAANPLIGKAGTPTVQRSLDGGSTWQSTTGTVTPIANGASWFNPSPADCDCVAAIYYATLAGGVSEPVAIYTHV